MSRNDQPLLAAAHARKRLLAVILPLLCLAGVASGQSAHFTDAIKIGNGNSGAAASARDATVTFDNPAGLVRIDRPTFTLGAILVEDEISFVGSSFQFIGPRVHGGSDSSTTNAAPNAFYARPISDRFFFGFGVFEPNGHDQEWSGILRFQTIKNNLSSLSLGPAIGYKVNDKFSVGLSLNLQYTDFWCNMFLPEFGSNGLPNGNDALLTTYGDDWTLGYRAGLLYQFSPETRIGLTYVSKRDHTLSGESTYASPTFPELRTDGYFVDITFAPMALFSVHHDIDSRWSVMGTVNYTWYDDYFDLVTLANTAAPPPFTSLPIPFFWEDAWGYAIGAELRLNDKWTLSTGYRYDEGQTTAEFRSVPEANEGLWSIGLGIRNQFNDTVVIDFGYRYVKREDGHVVAPGPAGQGNGTGEFGVVTGHQQVMGLMMSVKR